MRSEIVLISKILSQPDLWRQMLDSGVKQNYFYTKRPQFNFINDYYSKYGKVPSREVFDENYPNWEYTDSEEPVGYWLDKLRQDRSSVLQNEGVEKWLEARGKVNADDAAKLLIQLATELSNSCSLTKDLSMKDILKEKSDYKDKVEKKVVTYRSGIRGLDNVIQGGFKPEDLGVIMGPPENFKSWVLLYCAYNVWVQDEPVLLVSKEMADVDMRDRLSWLDFKFPLSDYERGMLDMDTRERYFECLERRNDRQEFIITSDDGGMDRGGGVNVVAAKIELYKPSICFIDGAYLLTDDRGSEGFEGTKNVFRDLKRLAKQKQIPIIVTTQPQRLKEKNNEPLRRKLIMEDVGSAWTIAQDCDFMIGVRKIAYDTIEVYKIKNRRGVGFDVQYRVNFTEGIFEELSEEEEILEEDIQTTAFDSPLYD